MPSIEARIQGLVHALEAGAFAKWLKLAVVLAIFAGVASWLLLPSTQRYRGLGTREGMENAVVAREISRGHGLTTKVLRPLALWQINKNKGVDALKQERYPETLLPPLHPLVLSVPIMLIRDWKFPDGPGVFVWRPDLVVALFEIFLFAVGCGVSYLAVKRLFDRRVGMTTAALIMFGFAYWQTALEGLPVPLMLILFSSAMYCLIRAVEAKLETRGVGLWLAFTGLFFGLLAVTQPLTIWIFLGVVLFCGIYFAPRLLAVVFLLLLFGVCVSPWLALLYSKSGSPFGIAGYTIFNGLKGSELLHLRQNGLDLSGIGLTWFRPKIQTAILEQFSNFFRLCGWQILAPIFFVSLAYPFKRPQIALFRWALLLMWFPAVFGMALFGPVPDEPSSKNLHLLFMPFMVAYGVAYLFTILPRTSTTATWIRIAVFSLIFLITALPLLFEVLPVARAPFHWPPYYPPVTARLAELYEPEEILSSDQAWATAWYGDRRTLMLPEKVTEFTNMSDFRVLGRDIPGLILTPTTGTEKFYGGITNGEYQEWEGFILRKPNLSMFPLQAFIPIGTDAGICLWADRERWKQVRPPK